MFSANFKAKILKTVQNIDDEKLEKLVDMLHDVRERKGRLFILGVGGSSANASHAVNDFRKLTGIESYAPTDNISELTARTNDEGWTSVFVNWLETSHLSKEDALLILSVGGGDVEKNVSANLSVAAEYAKKVESMVFGILGRDGGDVAKIADMVILIPNLYNDLVTPITESLQSVVLHLLVSHPCLAKHSTKW